MLLQSYNSIVITGTTYFSVYQGNLSAHFMEALGYDAWALGKEDLILLVFSAKQN